MYGFIDYDLLCSASNKIIIPNLEIMKMAEYFKTEEKKYCRLILSIDESNLDSYEKIYFFNETHSSALIPDNILKLKNVEYRGLVFSKGIYNPFEKQLIEYTLPKINIYIEYLRKCYSNGMNPSLINHFIDDGYYRIYAGINKLPIPPLKINKRIFIYDDNIFYDDWEKTLDELCKRKPSSILCVHPIVCNTISKYFKIKKYNAISNNNDIILNTGIPLNETHVLFNKYELKFLSNIAMSSRVFLPLGGDKSTPTMYYRDLIYTINLLYCFWAKGIYIKIKFIEPSVGFKNPIINLSRLIEKCTNFSTKNKMSSSIKDKFPKNKKANIWVEYNKLKKYNKKVEYLFNYSFNELKDMKIWRC